LGRAAPERHPHRWAGGRGGSGRRDDLAALDLPGLTIGADQVAIAESPEAQRDDGDQDEAGDKEDEATHRATSQLIVSTTGTSATTMKTPRQRSRRHFLRLWARGEPGTAYSLLRLSTAPLFLCRCTRDWANPNSIRFY